MIDCLFVVHEPLRFCKAAKTYGIRARDEAGTCGKGTRTGRRTARLPGIKCGSGGSGPPMMRSGLPSASICPNSKSYFPFDPQSGGCFGLPFFQKRSLVFAANSKVDM
jgi:hypothetical protein